MGSAFYSNGGLMNVDIVDINELGVNCPKLPDLYLAAEVPEELNKTTEIKGINGAASALINDVLMICGGYVHIKNA